MAAPPPLPGDKDQLTNRAPLPAAAVAPAIPDRVLIRAPELASPAAVPQNVPEMPIALSQEFVRIEEWAQANWSDARKDAVRFWILKIPAILVSASSGVLAYYDFKGIAVLAGAIGSFCVLLDGLNPGGALRNVHLRSVNELRILQNSMRARWDAGLLRGHNPSELAADIIDFSAKEKERINVYITSAETSLGTASSLSRSPGSRARRPH